MTLSYQPNHLTPRDESHLIALIICHYVLAGITAASSLPMLIYVLMGLLMVNTPAPPGVPPGTSPQAVCGAWFMMCGGGGCITLLSVALLTGLTGWAIGHRRWYLFCTLAACLHCLMVPLGTILAVFTLIVLSRPSVKEAFRRTKAGEISD